MTPEETGSRALAAAAKTGHGPHFKEVLRLTERTGETGEVFKRHGHKAETDKCSGRREGSSKRAWLPARGPAGTPAPETAHSEASLMMTSTPHRWSVYRTDLGHSDGVGV